jgi:hypothetical protein
VNLTWDQVRAWRVSRQHLDRRLPSGRLLEAIRDVCGIHAQLHSSAELQLWARVSGVTPEDIRDALWRQRSLVRTWAMRGTLHLFTATDLPLYVASLRQHDRWWKGAWLRMIGLSEEELRSALDAVRDSLGATPVTREQLAAKVVKQVGERGGKRMMSGWGEMLKPAAFHGYLCSGPPRGQSVTFVRPDRWLREWRLPDGDAAWREVLRRYLHTYGPATREEFARWWGMQPASAGRVMKSSGDDLAEVQIEEYRASAVGEDVKGLQRAARQLPPRLLPAFDVYVVGTRPRHSLVDPRFQDRVFRKAGWISPVVLLEGRVAGVWKQERSGSRLQVTVEAFAKLSAADRKALTEEGDRLGRFGRLPSTVSFGAARS